MKFYWTLRSIPELKDLEPWQRRSVWRKNYLRSLSRWRTWPALLCGGIIAVVLATTPYWLPFPNMVWAAENGLLGLAVFILFCGLGGGFGCFVGLQVVVHLSRPDLRLAVEKLLAERPTGSHG